MKLIPVILLVLATSTQSQTRPAAAPTGQSARDMEAAQAQAEKWLSGGWRDEFAKTQTALSQPQLKAAMDQAQRDAKNAGATKFALPQTAATPTGVDPAKYMDRLAQARTQRANDDSPPKVMIFASLGMPEASLRRLARDAKKIGVPILLRGLKYGVGQENYRRSIAAIAEFKDTGAQFQIHPQLFQSYSITAVPAVVVSPSPSPTCTRDQCQANHATALGDVPLAYSLERLASRKDQISHIARDALAKLSSNR